MLTAKWSESFPDPSQGCSHDTQTVAVTTKQEWHLFYSALPEVRLLFEGSHLTMAVFVHGNML